MKGPGRARPAAGAAWALALGAVLCAGAVARGAAPGDAGVRGSPAARLSRAAAASEYWDLTAAFESGHRLFARFSITNEGPGSETAFAIGHLLLPDGRAVPFQNGRRRGRWSLSRDGLHLEVGSSRLDQRSAERRLTVLKEKKGIRIDLRFGPEARSGRPLDPGAEGYRVDLLHAAAPVEGTLWVRGMEAPLPVRGRLAATHTWMERSETELALRRIEFFSLGGEMSLYLSDHTTPGGERTGWLVLEPGGGLIGTPETTETALPRRLALTLSESRELRDGEPATYPVPRTLHLRGATRQVRVEGEIQLSRGEVLLSHDPLGVIPQPFRLLMSLKMRPRRVWIESPFEVRLTRGSDDSTHQLTGSGIASVTFLNPIPRSQSS